MTVDPTHRPGPVLGWGPRPESPFGPELTQRLAMSVDEHEAAVILESAGISDRVAVADHGARDVFDLAARARAGTGAPAVQTPPREDWYPSPAIALLRGCTFTCSGVTAVALAASFAGERAGMWVLFACAAWIAAMQGISFLSHLVIERGGGNRALGIVFPVGISVAVPLAVACVAWATDGASTALVTAVAMLTVTDIVLLLLIDRPIWAGTAMVPVVTVSAIAFSRGPLGISTAVAVWSVVAVVLTMITVLGVSGGGRVHRVPLDLADVGAAIPYVLMGLGIGMLSLETAVLAARSTLLQGAPGSRWLTAALAFLVPVSCAELMVIELRRSLLLATAQIRELGDHRLMARRAAVRMWIVQVGLTAVTAALASSILTVSLEPLSSFIDTFSVVVLFGMLAIALTAALLLQSSDRVGTAAALLWLGAIVTGAALLVTSEWSELAAGTLFVVGVVGVYMSSRACGRISSFR